MTSARTVSAFLFALGCLSLLLSARVSFRVAQVQHRKAHQWLQLARHALRVPKAWATYTETARDLQRRSRANVAAALSQGTLAAVCLILAVVLVFV